MANTAASHILAEIDKGYKDVRLFSPKPRTRWWRQVHKGWKRGNTLRHGVRERHLRAQAEEPLGSLCPAFGGDTQRRFLDQQSPAHVAEETLGPKPKCKHGEQADGLLMITMTR